MKKIMSLFTAITVTLTALPFAAFSSSVAGVADEPPPFEFVAGSIMEDISLVYPPPPPMLSRFSAYSAVSESYVSDQYVSAVENQSDTGLCWAYSATAAVESNMLRNSLGPRNFSEVHMGYSTSSGHVGSAYGDALRPDVDSGGNRMISASYLMRGIPLRGLVNDSDDRLLNGALPDRDASVTEGKPKRFTVQNFMFLSGDFKADITETRIKEAILEYGAVSASMYFDDAYYNDETSAYYISDGPTVFLNGDYAPYINHDVEVVGWDDGYGRENFKTVPERDGAWRVKNSYGKNWGEEGFFWVSYDDSNFPLYIYAIDGTEPYNANANVYEYDYLRWVGRQGNNRTVNLYSNVFSVKRGYDTAERVVVAVPTPNVTLSVDIIPNFNGFAEAGYTADSFEVKGAKTTVYPGYYTIDLNVPVQLGEEGSQFAVVVRAEASDPTHSRIAYSSGQRSVENTSYMANSDGVLEASDRNFCIKAVTGGVLPYDLGSPYSFTPRKLYNWTVPEKMVGAAQVFVAEYDFLNGMYSFFVDRSATADRVEGQNLFSSRNNDAHKRVLYVDSGKIIFDLRGLEGSEIIFTAPVTVKSAYLSLLPPEFHEKCDVCGEFIEECVCVYCDVCGELIDDCVCVYCDVCGELTDDCICVYCDVCGELIDDCICVYCDICGKLTKNCVCVYCDVCGILKSGCVCYILGDVDGDNDISIFDALEILKYLVRMENDIEKTGDPRSLNAALITDGSKGAGKPTIFDALEILMWLVKADGVLMREHGL